MIDLKAIAKDAAERVHKNGGCVPQMAFAPILFALQDALSTTPARAEAQDEGAAGERSEAIQKLLEEAEDFTDRMTGQPWACEIIERLVEVVTSTSAHPSPTPAADDDRVRIPAKWFEVAEYATERGLAVHESNIRLEEFRRVVSPEALAALKSEGK